MIKFKMIKEDEKIQKNTKSHRFVRNFVRNFYNTLIIKLICGEDEIRTRGRITPTTV